MITRCSVTLEQHDDGSWNLWVGAGERGEPMRTLLQEESQPRPYLGVTAVVGTAFQMATEALEAVEPQGLWALPPAEGHI